MSTRRKETPCAAPMPSILEMGRLIRSLDDAHFRVDEEQTELLKNKGNFTRHQHLERIKEMADDRKEALTDLAMSTPAISTGDAAVHVVLAKSIAEDLENCDYPDHVKYMKLRQLNRLLASIMPVVAEAAGVTILEIGGEWMAGAHERLFPDLGEGA